MSDYPIDCFACGRFIGNMPSILWEDNYLCEKCLKIKEQKKKREGMVANAV